MPFFTMLLTFIVSFLVSELLRPKPNLENAKPAGLGDFQVPTATEGRVVPIIWGRVNIKGANTVWYGALEARRIRKKIKTGLFSSSKVTIGYRYYLGLQMALCRGELSGANDRLWNIRVDDSDLWGENGQGVNLVPGGLAPTVAGAAGSISAPSFFGDDDDAPDGIEGNFEIYSGSDLQAASAYLTTQQGKAIGYRGTCYWLWKTGYIGNSPQVKNFEYELSRYPNQLGVPASEAEVDGGANPACVLFEIFTNSEWGLGLSPTEVDTAGLQAIATTLKSEGNGFAWIWDSKRDIATIINQIEEQTDGVVNQDPFTGQFRFTLVRDDYTPGTLPLLDESNVLDVQKFRRPSWDSTSNVVNVQYVSRQKNYLTTYAIAQDSANVDIVQSVNVAELRFPGCKTAALANALAWRELRLLSYPIATGKLIANRTQYDLKPGDVRELSWDRLGLIRLPIRITKIDRGNILKGQLALDFSEDIFSARPGSFSDDQPDLWVPPNETTVANFAELLFEAPYVASNANETGTASLAVQIFAAVVRGGQLETGYAIATTRADVPTIPADPIETDTIPPGTGDGFCPYGELTAALDRGQANGFVDSVGFQVDALRDVEGELVDADAGDLENLVNLCQIDDELILFSTAVDLGGGVYEIKDIVRGALDTVPDDHAIDAAVYFWSYGIGFVNSEPEADITQNWKVRLTPFTPYSEFDFSLTPINQIQTVGRAGKAYPPRNVEVNPAAPGGGYFPVDAGSPSGAELVGFLAITWAGSDKFSQPRATAWDDPHVTQEPATAFRLRIIEDPGGADTVKLDVSGIPAGATEGAYNAAAFADDTVTDVYKAELSSTSVNGESQVWDIGPFTIYGYGYKWDEKYGGDNAGVILEKGDSSPTIDPIPGVVATSNLRVTLTGTFNAGDDLRGVISFFELGAAQSQNEDFFLDGTGKASLNDYVVELRDFVLANFDPIKVQATTAGDVLTISSAFGNISGRVYGNAPGATISRVQSIAPGVAEGTGQIVHFDLWEGDPSTEPNTEILAPASLTAYNAPVAPPNLYNKLTLQVVGLTNEAKMRLPSGGAVRTITWAGKTVAPGTQAINREIPLRDGDTDGDYTTDLLSQLRKLRDEDWHEFIADVSWTNFETASFTEDDPQDRPGVEVVMRLNYKLVVASTFEAADENTIYAGAFGPVKLLGKQLVEPRWGDYQGSGLSEIFRVSFTREQIPGQSGFQDVVAGQVYNIKLGATTFSETAIAGDATDSPFVDGILSRLKTTIDGGGVWTVINENQKERELNAGPYTWSIDIERDTAATTVGSDFDAWASYGLKLDVEQFDT